MRRARVLLALVLFLVAILPVYPGQASSAAQVPTPSRQAQSLLSRLTPEEKVGQLFLVTFKGNDTTAGTQISDLVTNQHVGGIILSSANDNFTGPENTVSDIYRVTSSLQQQVWDANQEPSANSSTGTPANSHYVPLFIGVSQDGDGYPNDQILNGLTPVPDLLAIGSTWKPDLARQIGAVLGSELQAIGFNLFLGPSLDVLDTLPTDNGENLSSSAFGGDPFWVGQMGQAYIQGIHQGSNGHMAVISEHFPGRGAADRSAEEEVATVRKTLDQLKKDELVPFSAVAGGSDDLTETTDGLMMSHVRYGFQGSIRSTTRPIDLDPAAIDQLLKQTPFTTWRQNGGLLVSDDLGSPALRRFYDTTGQVFDARQVVRNAFLSGSDLLYMNNLVADGDPDSYTTILRTLALFVQKYREDRAFAERVDASVMRILDLKFRMYPQFNLSAVIPSAENLSKVGQSQQITFEVARQGATLISPDAQEMESALPRPPGTSDRIVFISDQRTGRQCSKCADQVWLAADALQNAVMRLYGPQSGGQVLASRLSSYTLMDLQNMLNGTSRELSPLEQDLRQTSWIVFAVQDAPTSRIESQAVRRFLAERPDLYRNKKVIAFSFSAPIYLDATDISKLTAYYGLYSKIPAFVDVAARILFQELSPTGASPISVSGVGYDLPTTVSPDPKQIIPLSLDTPDVTPTGKGTNTPMPTQIPVFKVGDSLPLKTGVIYDHNHNEVPDGTPVRFLFTLGGETGTVQQIDSSTTNGIARATYHIINTGLLEARVVSDPAVTSNLIRLDVSTAGGVVTPIVPTSPPTETPTPTETTTPTVTPTATPAPLPPARPGTQDWILSMIVIWSCAGAIYLFTRQRFSIRWGFRWGMTAAGGGLLAYLYFAILRLVNENQARQIGMGNMLPVVVLGIGLGWVVGWFWRRWIEQRARTQPERHITGPKSPTS